MKRKNQRGLTLIELIVAIGLPSALFAAVGLRSRKLPPSAWAAFLVLTILNFSGKNLSEVARLWLPFIPALLVANNIMPFLLSTILRIHC